MLHRILALAACLLLFTCLAFAQEPMAPLQGYVFAEGKPLAGATVVLLNESGEMPRATTDLPTEPRFIASAATDVNGSFLFFEVPRGKLSLHVSDSGFLPNDQYVEFYGPPVTVHIDLARGQVAVKAPSAAPAEETIFYATDRKPSGVANPATFFTNERSSDGMHYGTAVVSVPSNPLAHTLTPEEALGLSGDRVSNVVLVTIKDEPKLAFFSQLEGEVQGKDALVFIHGYSNSFEYSARRLGALKHDLNFSGPVILYSWASRNSVGDYSDDEATADWSSPHFQQFLRDLFRTGVRRVHLVAHSMGNRILLRGLESSSMQRVGQVVFAAPDVDADTFREALAAISKLADHFTEYANDRDRALWLSAKRHGLPRAGQLSAAIHNTDEDVVDATRVDTSLEHHSYFVDSPQVVTDIALVIEERVPPRPRLVQVRQGQINYWQLRP
jgi:esterase/lipase superfamily enzyme